MGLPIILLFVIKPILNTITLKRQTQLKNVWRRDIQNCLGLVVGVVLIVFTMLTPLSITVTLLIQRQYIAVTSLSQPEQHVQHFYVTFPTVIHQFYITFQINHFPHFAVQHSAQTHFYGSVSIQQASFLDTLFSCVDC